MTGSAPAEPVGRCCVVLHTHLPWLAHHGVWPVGEEWLYQAWAATYLPLAEVLQQLADEGRQDVLTLGMTPVLAAQLDDPFLLRQFHTWLADWQLRAQQLVGVDGGRFRDIAAAEHAAAVLARSQFESQWRHGASPVLRRLADAGVVELLGGPAAHPILPGLRKRWQRFALTLGLDDSALRFGCRPRGVWLPECAYRPGLEQSLPDAGVGHVVVDEASLPPGTSTLAGGRRVGSTDVVAFPNDWQLVQLVWGAPRGYPAGQWYRDFHSFEPNTGLHVARITGDGVVDKAPYQPDAASGAAAADADAFADAVRHRLVEYRDRTGQPGLAVVATDTELFGHWWHEGPQFLARLLRRLPEVGVGLTTLAKAAADGLVTEPVELGAGTWGEAKDFRVWEGLAVADLAAEQHRLQDAVAGVVDRCRRRDDVRRPELDQLVRQLMLALASDWPFLVSHDQGAGYARSRWERHRHDVEALLAALAAGDGSAGPLAVTQREVDGPFGQLDARLLGAP